MIDERHKLIRGKLKELGYLKVYDMDDRGFSLWFAKESHPIILAEYRQGGFEVFGILNKGNSIEETLAALSEYTKQDS